MTEDRWMHGSPAGTPVDNSKDPFEKNDYDEEDDRLYGDEIEIGMEYDGEKGTISPEMEAFVKKKEWDVSRQQLFGVPALAFQSRNYPGIGFIIPDADDHSIIAAISEKMTEENLRKEFGAKIRTGRISTREVEIEPEEEGGETMKKRIRDGFLREAAAFARDLRTFGRKKGLWDEPEPQKGVDPNKALEHLQGMMRGAKGPRC